MYDSVKRFKIDLKYEKREVNNYKGELID